MLKDRAQLFWGNFALHELPQYKAAEGNPEIGMCPRLNWGPKDSDYFATRHQAELFVKGIPDKLMAIVAPDSIWDRTRLLKASTPSLSSSLPLRTVLQ